MAYNYNELVKYYNTRNYQGAIDYLNSFTFEGENAIAVQEEINKLERSKAIEESIKERLGNDPERLQKYNFFQGIQNNYIDRDRQGQYADGTTFNTQNTYGTQYQNYINNLRTNDNKSINALAIDIDNEAALKRFQEKLGVKDFNNDLGVQFVALADGKYRAVINTNNGNLVKVHNAMTELIDASYAQTVASSGIAGTAIGGMFGGVGALIGAPIGASIGLAIAHFSNDYHVKGLSNGREYDTSDFNYDNIKDAVKLYNDCKETYDEVNENFLNETVESQISVSGYMSLGHAEAARLRDNELISNEDYNLVTKRWEDYMINLISGGAFADKKVYAWGQKDGDTKNGEVQTGIMLEEIKNTDAENVKNEILLAFQENRCEYSMATKDGVIGTMFTVTADEEKGKISDAYGNRKLQVFVEGLYTDDYTEAYEQDTKTKAARQNADMKKIGYGIRLPNGEKVGYTQGVPYREVYNQETSLMERQPISETEMLQSLNESAIINRGVNAILKNYNPNTKKIELEGDNGEVEQMEVDEMLNNITDSTIDEIYPKGVYTKQERDMKKVLLYTTLVNNAYISNLLFGTPIPQPNTRTNSNNNRNITTTNNTNSSQTNIIDMLESLRRNLPINNSPQNYFTQKQLY